MAKARRAKKSEAPRKLLLIPVVATGIGASVLGMKANMKNTITETMESKVGTYEASANVKDVFTKNNTKYLPIVYNDAYERITKTDIENKFKEAGVTVESISSDTIKTGTQIKTKNATYTVIIYGDVNEDGQVNVRDVQSIVRNLLYEEELKYDNKIAANVENISANEINVRDAQRIVQFIMGTHNIIDNMPQSDLETDTEAPVIKLIGTDSVTVKVGEKYEDKGVIVTDNADYSIQEKLVTTGEVDTSKPGEYKITYNVTDSNGNKAKTVTRIVNVVDYIKSIEIVTPPKQIYKAGETITLEGMEAYAIYSYAGKAKTAIDISKISVSPTKAVAGMTEIKFTYSGFTKTIPVKVTGNSTDSNTGDNNDNNDDNRNDTEAPVIKLIGDAEVTIKVGEEYVDKGVTITDNLDTNIQNKLVTTGEVDTSKPGEYKIAYNVTDSSGNKARTVTRTVKVIDYVKDFVIDMDTVQDYYVVGEEVTLDGMKAYEVLAYAGKSSTAIDMSKISFTPEKVTATTSQIQFTYLGITKTISIVVDYIKDINISVDEGILKTDYKDGEEILLNGITAIATYDKKGQVDVTDSLSCEVKQASYDRNNIDNNTDREVKVICSKGDYKEETTIKINIIKQLETIEEELIEGEKLDGTTINDEIYKKMWIARIKAGEHEDGISLDKLTYKINDDANFKEIDENGVETEVSFEQAYEKDENGNYIDKYGNTITNENDYAQRVKLDGYVDVYFIGISDKEYKISIEAKEPEVYTEWKNTPLKISVTPNAENTTITSMEIGEFVTDEDRFEPGGSIIADLKFYHQYGENGKYINKEITVFAEKLQGIDIKVNGTEVSGLSGKFLAADGKAEATGTIEVSKIQIEADENYIQEQYGKVYSEDIEITAFAKEGSETIESNTVSSKVWAKAENKISIGKEGNSKLRLTLRGLTTEEKDNTEEYAVKMFNNTEYYSIIPIALSNQYGEIELTANDLINGKIEVKDSTGKDCIDVVGINEEGLKAQGKEIIKSLGIMVKDNEDELEKGTISVSYLGNVEKIFDTITILREDLSSIRYVNINGASAKRYEDVQIATVSAGPRQCALTNDNVYDIVCKIEKNGTIILNPQDILNNTGKVIKAGEINPGYYTKDLVAGFNVSIENGIATITFWGKELTTTDTGKYKITPYIIIDGKLVEIVSEGTTSVNAEVTEDTSVTKVTFNNGENFSGTAEKGAMTLGAIEFWHEYSCEKDGNPINDTQQIKNVNWNRIEPIVGAEYSGKVKINLVSDTNKLIDPVNNPLADGVIEYIDRIAIILDESANFNPAKFTIKVDGKEVGKDIKVQVGEKAVVESVLFGDQTNITSIDLYDEQVPASTNKDVKLVNGKYYTLVPINLVSSTGSLITSTKVTKGDITENYMTYLAGATGLVSFIDNYNEDDMVTPCIDVLGFDDSKNPISDEDADNTVVSYVGIALSDDGKDNKSQLKTIKLYYQKSSTGSSKLVTTININIK